MNEKLEQVDLVIFDLGGVIIDIDYSLTIHSMQDLGFIKFEEMYSQQEQSTLFTELEVGSMSPLLFINKLMSLGPKDISPNQIVSAWNKMIGPFREEVILIIKKLSKNYKICLLSNTNDIHMELVMNNWKKNYNEEFKSLFSGFYLSHEIGYRKPNPEAFNHVLNSFQLTADRALFIDDSPQHIIGAEKVGIKTHHFKDMKGLIHLIS